MCKRANVCGVFFSCEQSQNADVLLFCSRIISGGSGTEGSSARVAEATSELGDIKRRSHVLAGVGGVGIRKVEVLGHFVEGINRCLA